MTNPYDVYNDNRAYIGYIRAIRDIREQVESGKSIEEILREIDIDDRFRHLLDEE